MGVHCFENLIHHVGHKIVCVTYCDAKNPEATANVAVECETCNEVLTDFESVKECHE